MKTRAGWIETLIAWAALRGSRATRYVPLQWLLWPWYRMRHARKFTVVTRDGVQIAGLFIPAAKTSGLRRLPVLQSHGWLECKEFHIRDVQRWTELGHDVLLVDLRAHGRSQGVGCTFGAYERHDLVDVIDHAQKQGWVDHAVLTSGYSLSAAVLLQHAAIDKRVAGIVAVAPFADFRQAIYSFHQRLGLFMNYDRVIAGFEAAGRTMAFDLDDASTLDAMAKINVPTLLIVGDRDVLLPGELHTHRLVERLPEGRGELLVVKNAGHISVCYRRWLHMERALKRFSMRVGRPRLALGSPRTPAPSGSATPVG